MNAPRIASVLVVDDSAVVRQAAAELLSADPALRVMAAVADPVFALARMRAQWPDVILLDLEMPRMDGLTFLRQVMAMRPTPVVVCSALTGPGAASTLQALAAGAFAAVEKPRLGVRRYLQDAAGELVATVKAAAQSNIHNLASAPLAPTRPAAEEAAAADAVVAIGCSTGGTQALERVLTGLTAKAAAIVVVQHMPEKFTTAFAERLDGVCRIEVKEAASGDRVRPGRALIAPGGRHMTLAKDRGGFVVEVKQGPPVHHHRPSVDVLFRSVARAAGARALGVIMTGMGGDGALGLLDMRNAGARTVAQDEASCVVFGMPREAIRLGAASQVLSLEGICSEVLRFR